MYEVRCTKYDRLINRDSLYLETGVHRTSYFVHQTCSERFWLFSWLSRFLRIFIPNVFKYPLGHLAPKMEGCIICHPGNAMILIRVICAFKINVIFYKRRYHLGTVLKVNIIICQAMNDQVFALDHIGEIK